jgi:hypothetical protein
VRRIVEGIVKDDGVGLTFGFLTVTTLVAFGYQVVQDRRGSPFEGPTGDEEKDDLIDRILVLVRIPDGRQEFYSKQLAKLDTGTLIRLLREMGEESR